MATYAKAESARITTQVEKLEKKWAEVTDASSAASSEMSKLITDSTKYSDATNESMETLI